MGITWIYVLSPVSDQEIIKLTEKFNFPVDYLTRAFDRDEVARSENLDRLDKDTASLLLLLYPKKEAGKDGIAKYITKPMSIILSDGVIITAAEGVPDFLTDVTEQVELDRDVQVQFLLEIVKRVSDEYIKHLKEINVRTGQLEKQLTSATASNEMLELMWLQESIVYFDTATESNQAIISRLSEIEKYTQSDASKELLRDVEIENLKARTMVKRTGSLLGQISSTVASIVSHNLNQIMRTLTFITIVMTVPTIFSSFWGMNVGVPWQGDLIGFWIVLVISVVAAGASGYLLRKLFR